jgi:restriction system protein
LKFRMSENSLFAILLRKPWWISLAAACLVALLAAVALPRQYAGYGIVSGLPFLAICVIAAIRQAGTPSAAQAAATIEQARSMSWNAFSAAMEEGLRRDGYDVTRLAIPEADFSISKAGRVSLVSCKRWKAASSGFEPLRDLRRCIEAREAQHGIYVAVGEINEKARRFAAQNGIRLMRGAELATLLRGAGRGKTAIRG